jgi:hypothetical protein
MNKKQKGVAIVEFALILPFLLLLSFTAAEFGRAIWQYNTLTKSVRDAVRYLSIQTPGTKIPEARNLMVYGSTSDTGQPLAPGLNLDHVRPTTGSPADCCTWQTAGSNPVINTVTVRIKGYTFNSMFASVFGITFGAVRFPDITATMRSYL